MTDPGPSGGRNPAPRTAQQSIDLAIAENKKWDWLCFALVVVFGGIGAGGLLHGILTNQWWTILGGAAGSAAFVGPLYYAYSTWQQNIALRALEASLGDPKESAKTFEAFRKVYLARVTKGKP